MGSTVTAQNCSPEYSDEVCAVGNCCKQNSLVVFVDNFGWTQLKSVALQVANMDGFVALCRDSTASEKHDMFYGMEPELLELTVCH